MAAAEIMQEFVYITDQKAPLYGELASPKV